MSDYYNDDEYFSSEEEEEFIENIEEYCEGEDEDEDEFVEDEPDTSEDEETTSEETTMQENCPLLDDILASDKINDPIQRIIDNYSNIDLFSIDQVQFTATKSGKKITITIANA